LKVGKALNIFLQINEIRSEIFSLQFLVDSYFEKKMAELRKFGADFEKKMSQYEKG